MKPLYIPKGKAKEYGDYAVNIYTGCSNAGVYCSICHKKVYKEDYAWCNRKNKVRSAYCPNCGSKMDLEDKP